MAAAVNTGDSPLREDVVIRDSGDAAPADDASPGRTPEKLQSLFSGTDDESAMSPLRRHWLGYFAFWFIIGMLQAVAEWEHFVRSGTPGTWQPFVWELSSTAVVGPLAILVHRWNLRLIASRAPWPLRALGYVAGMSAFALSHTALMYGLRFGFYAVVGAHYDPGPAMEVISYEAPKDAVTYILIVAMSLGLNALAREQRQARLLSQMDGQLVQARLAQLQAHVQPHFLFNTLNLVSSVMQEDVARADQILCELADLLRHSLDAGAGRVPTQSLARELQWVEPFLAIMRQRFGDRLIASIDVDAAARACEVPTLVLMAPMENALKHGVTRVRGPAVVRLDARVDGGRLMIAVSNTAAIADGAGQATDVSRRQSGTGLADLRARLRTLYGNSASLATRLAGAGFHLTIELPARSAAP